MKKLLTSIALIISINFCYGQSDNDTGWVKIDTSSNKLIYGSGTNWFMTFNEHKKRNNKIDTVGCFILYSDKKVFNGVVHSIFAYEVVNNYMTCCGGAYGESYYTAQEHIKYIDQNKKEFPESIIIWQSVKK